MLSSDAGSSRYLRGVSLLFFVDESADHLNHFHAGVLLDGTQVACAEEALDKVAELAVMLGYPRAEPELHGLDIWAGNNGWGILSFDERFQVLEAALDVLASCDIEVISRGIVIDAWIDKYGAGSLHGKCFQNLLERLNERLKVRGAHALVIADEHASKKQLKQEVKWAKKFGTWGYRGQKFDHIIDTVHFVDSRESRLIQLADIAVFTRRRRAMGTEKHPNAEAGLARMYARVLSATPDPTGQFDTLYRAFK